MPAQLIRTRVWVDIEVPEGATHYFGSLCDTPTWMKSEVDALGGRAWFLYEQNSKTGRKDWMFLKHSDEPPAFGKPLREIIL